MSISIAPTTAVEPEIVRRTPIRLAPDPSRVITKLIIPGEEIPTGDSRAYRVIGRVVAMDDAEVAATLGNAWARSAHRHRNLAETWLRNFRRVAQWYDEGLDISNERELLIGAYFTHEISVETASLCNPSIVAHPHQGGLDPGQTRFVMSLRAISEGHISSIEFRTGVVEASGDLTLDPPGPFLETGLNTGGPYDRARFHQLLAAEGCDNEIAAMVLDRLEPVFLPADLDLSLAGVHHQLLTRAMAQKTLDRIRWVGANNYAIEFPPETAIDERVIWPAGTTEAHGMEDARFVRFVEADGSATFLATYTAFDGASVVPQLISTEDFCSFRISQLSGPYARNKGLALFPRQVGGKYLAMSRWDRESNSLAMSEDGYHWSESVELDLPRRPWEVIQVGNCGSPIETPEGWLVLTHGVGPMRFYCIGALLLDLEEPSRVIGSLPEPLLIPQEIEREGYVPNVVYSCGGMLNEQVLVVPVGLSDTSVGVAAVDLPGLLEQLLSSAGRTP